MTTAARLRRSLTRLAAVVPVLASLTFVGATVRMGPVAVGCAQAATLHHAALVVEHSDGAVIRRCVSFSADSITGDQLLAASGVQYATADYGSTGKAVCQIDYEPVSYPPGCWTASSPYWAMFVSRGGGGWRMSSLGISSQTFGDGDSEGFRYEGQSDYSVPPGPAGVCPPPTTPTVAPAPTPPPPAPNRSNAPNSAAAVTPSSAAHAAAGAARSSLAPSPSATPAPTAGATSTPLSAVATSPRRSPPARPASFSAGIWAASVLGAVLLLLLGVQARRLRRGHSPPGWQR